MKYLVLLFLILSLFASSLGNVYAQQPQLATYREVAQVLVDQRVQNMTTAFITLSSSSPLEMHVPTSLDEKIRNTGNVTSIAITNADQCVLGVRQQTCVVVTIYDPSLIATYNITKIQSTSRSIGDTLIGDINKSFLLNTQFWSTYVEPKGALGHALGTSGSVAGNRTIQVVYTADQEKSSYLLDQLTSMLLPTQITSAGGFYDVAKQMAQDPNSAVTFAITPASNGKSIYQLQVSRHMPIRGDIANIRPLELFGASSLQRSNYFSGGFFPLNSVFELSVLSNHDVTVTDHGGDILPTSISNGLKVPTDLTKAGWIFDPDSGQRITGIYLFGKTTSVTGQDLALTIGTASAQPPQNVVQTNQPTKTNPDYSIYVIIGIVIAGGAAVYLFMRKR